MSGAERIILYVPGLKPKPPADVHRFNLLRCLSAGLLRTNPRVAEELAAQPDCLRIVSWPQLFYPAPSDAGPDEPGLQRLLALEGPEPRDIEEARHWHKSMLRLTYLVCDALPMLIDWVADPALKATLHDSLRYLRNEEGIATRIRALVKDAIVDACAQGKRVLLIAHSMGSVVSWDVLWELSRQDEHPLRIDTFMTLASPLGLNFMRHRLLNLRASGAARYPDNIRRWHNLAAVGDLTALQRRFAVDYRRMLDLGLVSEIRDEVELHNYFRGPTGLNVHKCYAYMINPRVANGVAEWWQGN